MSEPTKKWSWYKVDPEAEAELAERKKRAAKQWEELVERLKKSKIISEAGDVQGTEE